MNFFKKHFEKEKQSTKKIQRFFIKVLVIYWGIIGITLLVSPAWLIGLIFIVASGYIYYRIKK